jgi:hypothetical protein
MRVAMQTGKWHGRRRIVRLFVLYISGTGPTVAPEERREWIEDAPRNKWPLSLDDIRTSVEVCPGETTLDVSSRTNPETLTLGRESQNLVVR